MTKVKICGLSREADIEAVNAAGADYAGFVFFEKSKRNISFARAEELLKRLEPSIQSVAVCVSPKMPDICTMRDLGFDIIQIHGEIPADCRSDEGIALWQAVNIAGEVSDSLFCKEPNIKGYVIDGAQYGSGKTFDWGNSGKQNAVFDRLREKNKKIILAGGLNPDNVQNGIRLFAPDVVDVSSGVEINGKKDADLINAFIRKVRER